MIFKIFPASITPDKRKVPLIKNWKHDATIDPNQIELWQQTFRDRINLWGVPTGSSTKLLVLDIDTKNGVDGFQSIRENNIYIPPTMTQKTINGGTHYIFQYPDDGNVYGNRAAVWPGVDVRGEGGFIGYYGTDNTPVAPAPVWLLNEALKRPEIVQGEAVAVSPNIAETIIEKSLEALQDAGEGERNNTLNKEAFVLGQLVSSGSADRQRIMGLLKDTADEIGLHADEITATIGSAFGGSENKPMTSPFGKPEPMRFSIPEPMQAESWTPEYFTLTQLLDRSKLRKPQLFKDWSTEDIHITTADGGTGKTTLKLYEAVCLALGESFLGFECMKPGKTLFITGEDSAAKLGAMIGRIAEEVGALNDNVKLNKILNNIVVKKDSDFCLITKDKQGFLHPNEIAKTKLLEAIEVIKPKLIVFDPISSFWGSESALNDMAKAVSRFMQDVVEKSGACVEMINHMGKTSSQNKDMSQFAGRGGTGLPSHARVSRVLRPVNDDEFLSLTGNELNEGESSIMCNVNKFSDGSPLYNKPFLIVRKGYLFERREIEPASKRDKFESIKDIEKVFHFVKNARSQNLYPSKDIIVAEFMSKDGVDRLSEKRIKNALAILKFTGFEKWQVRPTENPDANSKDKVYIITDHEGREV